ncbi:MAG: zinc-finger domain-containing protein [Burkholderiaceae bacterium]
MAVSSQDSAPAGVVELDATDLPAFCPNRRMSTWNAHPKVFLDLSHGGQARCPYCSTEYRLKPGVVPKGH